MFSTATGRPRNWHIGRSWSGTDLEDGCPCPKAPCGLVHEAMASPRCDQHPVMAAQTMRQRHPADRCTARPAIANTADPHVTYVSSAVILAATQAAQLHRRMQGERFTRLSLPGASSSGVYRLTGMLHEPAKPITPPPGCTEAWEGGGALAVDLEHLPDDKNPFIEEATERVIAAEALRDLLTAEIPPQPFDGVSIPLRPERTA